MRHVLVELGFKVHRGLISQGAVERLPVVKDFDPLEDGGASFGPGGELAAMDQLPVERTMPLGVAYPDQEIFRAEVVVPPFAEIQPDDQVIENPAFYFHRGASIGGGTLYLNYEYRALADTVPVEEVPTYVRQLDAAHDLMVYMISSR
jgi:hypothetical protein